MKKIFNVAATLAVAILMTGCMGAGAVKHIPLTMPDGEKATIVVHDRMLPHYLDATSRKELDYIVKGDVTQTQMAAVAKVEEACRLYTKGAHPHDLVAVLSSGVLYAIAGFVGVGAGSEALPGVLNPWTTMGPYGAAATGMAGVANGVITLGGKTYTFENCGREALGMFSKYGVVVLQKSPY